MVERTCREIGLRSTGQRLVIMRVLMEARDHPEIQVLHRRIAAIDPGVSLSTVYRTLNLLEDHGLVWRHLFGSAQARYEWAAAESHDHLIDLTDRSVTDFRSDEIEQLVATIAQKLGYRMVSRRLELYALPIDAGCCSDKNER